MNTPNPQYQIKLLRKILLNPDSTSLEIKNARTQIFKILEEMENEPKTIN